MIGGLPFPVSGNSACAVGFYSGMTGLTGVIMALAANGTSTVTLRQTSATATATLVDTPFTNTASIIVSGTYETT